MRFHHPTMMRLICAGWLVLATAAVGCRTMPAEDRPYTETRTYHAATSVDPEPHVLNITVHPPTRPLDYASPQRLAFSLVSGSLLQLRDTTTAKLFGRTLGVHSVGHIMIELKSVDPHTGQVGYLLTAQNTANGSEWTDQAIKQQVGFALFTRGVAGRTDDPDHVANDIDEPAEVGTRSARLRVVLSPETADRLFRFYDEFRARGVHTRMSLVSDPLSGDGASCASLAAAFLEVGGLLTPDMRAEWQRTLHAPEALVGDPEAGKKVAPRKLLMGPAARRWAGPCEPHRDITYFDTALMHPWIVRHAAANSEAECRLSRLLAMPITTIDARNVPTPTGPMFR
jgi:hypothetical protein